MLRKKFEKSVETAKCWSEISRERKKRGKEKVRFLK